MRIGSLCSGYGGLELGVQAVYGGTTAWVSDIDKGACKILAHRFPDVPNIGDMTTVDWSAVEPVDLICGGTPCQDLSHAGRRAGMTEGARSNLWVAMREAIAAIRPKYVVWENVRGAYSASADSAVEPCPGCVGNGSGMHLRALGRVLGDLSDLGYDASWHGLRAADVGAPHGRFRVFVVATDVHAERGGRDGWAPDSLGRPLRGTPAARGGGQVTSLLPTPAAYDGERGGPQHPAKRIAGGHSVSLQDAVHGMLPTPTARDWKGHGPADEARHDPNLSAISRLLPTPAVNDMGEGKTVEAWDEWTAKMKATHGNGNGHGASLSIEAQRLLPTPTSANAADGANLEAWEEARQALMEKGYNGNGRGTPLAIAVRQDQWGQYAEAIARWEAQVGPAPAPTMLSKKGSPQLSPAFSEWMMGVPAGWVTDVPDITRNEALKALGNGVVPQQAAEALRVMAAWEAAA